MSKTNYGCPKCGKPVMAWADLDAHIQFSVTEDGELTNETILNSKQTADWDTGEYAYGLSCTGKKCYWRSDNIKYPKSEQQKKLMEEALNRANKIEHLEVKKEASKPWLYAYTATNSTGSKASGAYESEKPINSIEIYVEVNDKIKNLIVEKYSGFRNKEDIVVELSLLSSGE